MNRGRFWRLGVGLLAAWFIAALVMPLPAHAQQRVHVVQRGENLYRIALRYGTTVQAIMRANGLSNPNFIWVGQRLVIPGSGSSGGSGTGGNRIHIVRAGQNLTQIARAYGTTVQAIVQANNLRNPSYIWVGQRLVIPGGGSGGSVRGGGSTSAGGAVHIVRRGENLSRIAARYGTSVWAIMQANGLRNANYIWVGQRLRIPAGGGSGGGSGSGGGGGKWIDVDLSSQRVRAYQGNTVLRTMIVSTGIARYPTPTGRFKILSKYPSVTMSGPGYYLPGVPHTMFFYRGYALHGTYWHNNFGTPMSHGCINLTRSDAAWLYSWAPLGTPVVIHW